ncbi:MAG TPA: choice-of-anchor D domain-containing protein, partial [Polyangiaceae bacterium]|nr:choice-of-anchor D domain-containing protein [Polyangiaceae bacterium]
MTLAPSAPPLGVLAGFTPAAGAASPASATSTVTVVGTVCGPSLSSLSFSGEVGRGQLSGWPTPPTGQQTAQIDFGPADCGGAAPASQFIILTNSGSADAHVTTATLTGAPGFSTDALDATIPAGEAATITLKAPSVPGPSPLTPVTATLSIETDVDTSPHTVTLTEEPRGAVLGFDTSPTANFGSFGRVVLLQAASQKFNVTNTGNAAASVTLATTAGGSGTSPFSTSNASFTIAANGTQTDAVTFAPNAAGAGTGTVALTATGAVCSALPAPLPLSGFGVGGGPSVAPSSLAFGATCGGAAAAPQSFIVSNKGTANMNWAMSAVTGPGKTQYTVSAVPPPGMLAPNASSTVTVTAAAIAAPAPNPSPTAYAASLTITTDVPFDDDHVVSLSETPLGDQLSLSATTLRFGQIPINTSTLAQTFTVTNIANPGSQAANLSFVLAGAGTNAYAMVPTSVSNLGPGGSISPALGVTFDPASPVAFPATIAVATTDALCTPLPTSIQLTGTGTQGMVSVSATTLAFGTDTSDASGLVNCGATGPARTFTISNVGNQQFNITGLSLGLGANSPYVLSGDATTLPAAIPIGGTTTITITPKAIPSAVANPNDASPFTDTLTVTTDAALDSPHKIALVMQARGAVIASTPAPATSWAFGTLGNGLIGTFSNTITNTGNAAASVSFQGLQHPTVFGLQNAPTIVAANAVTDVVGQFSPPATNQLWTDQGTLVVTAAQAFCEPLPSTWSSPVIMLSGSSISGSLPVTVAGSLAFPSTNCGSAAPAAQSITLTNTTNVAYVFTAQLGSGQFYTLQNPTMGDASAGIIPGNGVVVLGVTPQTVTPGQAAVAGAAPYADDLIVNIQSPTPSGVTIPISWTLNGAMLSLPQGLGPNKDSMGNQFYIADSQSGFTLPMDNGGNGTATVQFGVQPSGAFTFSPAPPISVEPNIQALPRLISASTDATCPSLTSGSATFLYSGPVCRPFPVTQVSIQSCVGTF